MPTRDDKERGMKTLQLTVVTPDASFGPYICDSVRINTEEDSKGRQGGSCGIRPGHTDAMFSLDKGPLTAYLDGGLILKANCGGGIASVSGDVVTVITEEYEKLD